MKIVMFYLMPLASILRKYHFGKLYYVMVRIIHQFVGKETVITVAREKPFLFLI